MMDPRMEAVEWLRNHVSVHDPEPDRWVPLDVLLPLMSREPWPAESWAEPSSWEPLVYSLDIDAGNYHVHATARQWGVPDAWVIAIVVDCAWEDRAYHSAWIARPLASVVDEIIAYVERLHGITP